MSVDLQERAREIAAGLTVIKTGPCEYTVSDRDRCVVAVVRLAHGADLRAVAAVLAEGTGRNG